MFLSIIKEIFILYHGPLKGVLGGSIKPIILERVKVMEILKFDKPFGYGLNKSLI